MSATAEQKSFDTPDETRSFEFGALHLLKIGGAEIGMLTLEPGWRWSEHVKPIAGTDLCEAPHFQYHVQGTLHVVMADGTEFDAGKGDVTALPQGHDAWVVGDEPVVLVGHSGAGPVAAAGGEHPAPGRHTHPHPGVPGVGRAGPARHTQRPPPPTADDR